MPTRRSQRTYDHRLVHLVRETGDITVDQMSERVAWAKTSNRVAVSARVPGGNHTIYLIDVAAPANPVPLTEGINPSWSSDDARLVCERIVRLAPSTRRNLLVIDLSGATETTLATGAKRFHPRAPVWRL